MSSLFSRYVGWRLRRLAQRAVDRGLPPSWIGYRCVRKESLEQHVARNANDPRIRVETIHPERRFENPLPRNFEYREDLPDDRGWWHYSMRDVPCRRSAPTVLAALPDVRILPWMDPEAGYFRPAILSEDRSSIELREISFRGIHRRLIGSAGKPLRVERATWILERVYNNHSHWLTAHLPKLIILRDRGELSDVLMPPALTPVMESSMKMLGIDPNGFRRFDPHRPLDVHRLTVFSTDRFRPELLRSVRQAVSDDTAIPTRRLFISRAKAGRRRLLNEAELWPILNEAGFERVYLEDMDFERQVRLMQEASVVIGPHGAGLTNMIFCGEGTAVAEIADLGFPNPNFYALAAAMGHRYWLIPGRSVGDVHPLQKDLTVEEGLVADLLPRILAHT